MLPVLGPVVEGAGGVTVDVGSGPGLLTARLAGLGPVVGVEPSAAMRRRWPAGAAGVPVVAGLAEALPVGDGTVAAVVSSCSLKHWPDRPAALAEAARALRPGGVLALVEVDGAQRAEVAAFVRRTGLARPLHPVYALFARTALTWATPSTATLAAEARAAGFTDVVEGRTPGLPFLTVTARWGAPVGGAPP